MKISKDRNLNIDLIRCVAVFLVISVHFLMNLNYYGEKFEGAGMYVMTVVRVISITCVPLFMTITGYLMCKKKLNRDYYKSIWRVLMIYLLCSIANICFKKYYIGYPITFKSAILSILGFTGAQYSWYIDFYIGLFLLIPFINLIWNGLEKKTHKQIFLITLICLTILPSLFNIYDWNTESFFLKPWLSSNYQNIFPTWWMNIFPLTYYFLGAYIKEYDIKIGKAKNLLAIALLAIIFGSFNFFRNYSVFWDAGIYMDYYGFESFIMTTLLFMFLVHLDLKRIPNFMKKTIVMISKLSLATYLMSYIADNIVYPKLLVYTDSFVGSFKYFLPTVVVVFILSNLLSLCIQLIVDGIVYIIKKIKLKRESHSI